MTKHRGKTAGGREWLCEVCGRPCPADRYVCRVCARRHRDQSDALREIEQELDDYHKQCEIATAEFDALVEALGGYDAWLRAAQAVREWADKGYKGPNPVDVMLGVPLKHCGRKPRVRKADIELDAWAYGDDDKGERTKRKKRTK